MRLLHFVRLLQASHQQHALCTNSAAVGLSLSSFIQTHLTFECRREVQRANGHEASDDPLTTLE